MSIKIKRILRFIIVVEDLDKAVEDYKRLFGVIPFSYGISAEQHMHWWSCEIGEGDCAMELFAPLNDPAAEAPVGKFLKKHGEGLYGVILQTDGSADETVDALRDIGLPPSGSSMFWNDSIVNASGELAETWQEHYIHHRDTNGVLITLATLSRKLYQGRENPASPVPTAGRKE